MQEEEKILSNAQYRKSLSIAFFNATNAGIAIVAPMVKDLKVEEIKQSIVMYRDFFLEEHKIYYSKVIAKVGLFDVNETIKRLLAAKTLDELRSVWIALSEDERQDKTIIDEVNKLKAKYAKS